MKEAKSCFGFAPDRPTEFVNVTKLQSDHHLQPALYYGHVSTMSRIFYHDCAPIHTPINTFLQQPPLYNGQLILLQIKVAIVREFRPYLKQSVTYHKHSIFGGDTDTQTWHIGDFFTSATKLPHDR